ncbi:MAG TPA: alpha/beta hydrolase [Casimicrobiaceae bacterium]|jgi:pimeloyl-ACP methyl ester carboxylesterase
MLTRTAPRERQLLGLSPHGFHRVIYYEWGVADNPNVVICVHGVGRNARDFDVLAEVLSSTHRVLAVDMPGRGKSAWLRDPNDYVFPVYLSTLTAVIARAGVQAVSWVGTSMGGLLGIAMAAQPDSPVARLVINDVGTVIEPAALARIADYFGKDPTFATYAEIERYIRDISAPFGPLTDAQWTYLTETNVRQRPDGRWGLAYDPGIAVPFRQQVPPAALWNLWDAIKCPTLILRGAQSDMLLESTAREMAVRGPRPRVIEFAGVGHAPMLLTQDQYDPVVAFLREGGAS